MCTLLHFNNVLSMTEYEIQSSELVSVHTSIYVLYTMALFSQGGSSRKALSTGFHSLYSNTANYTYSYVRVYYRAF